MKNLFGIGFEKVNELQQEERKANGNLYDFYLKDGQEGLIRFLTLEPVVFKAHTLKVDNVDAVSGKHWTRYETHICTGDDTCEGCKQVDSFDATKPNRASIKCAFLVIDGSEYEYKDKNGDSKVLTDRVKFLLRGSTDLSVIQRLVNRGGLDRPFYVSKVGKKNPLIFEKLDEVPQGKNPAIWGNAPLTEEVKQSIISSLPEHYQELAKGEYGLYEILFDKFKPLEKAELPAEPKPIESEVSLGVQKLERFF